MNTYQFVWARDTHTFSCHHNTEPTTSTTRADSSSDSSSGPLKARQRCSLEEEAAAGRRERRRGEVAQQPSEWAGRGGENGGGRKGRGEEETKQTHPASEAASQPRARDSGSPDGSRAAAPCSRRSEPTSTQHLQAHPAPRGARFRRPPGTTRRGQSARPRGARACPRGAEADTPGPRREAPGTRGGSSRPGLCAHPAGPPPAAAPHARPPLPRPDAPSQLGSGGRGYEPGPVEHPPLSAPGGGRTPPCASSPSAPRSTPARRSSVQASPLRAPASPGLHPAPPPTVRS